MFDNQTISDTDLSYYFNYQGMSEFPLESLNNTKVTSNICKEVRYNTRRVFSSVYFIHLITVNNLFRQKCSMELNKFELFRFIEQRRFNVSELV